jgi:hypothetical protein
MVVEPMLKVATMIGKMEAIIAMVEGLQKLQAQCEV